MMASQPIEINQQAFNLDAMMGGMNAGERREVRRGDWVNVDNMIENILDQFAAADDFMVSNSINMNYVRYLQDMPQSHWSAIHLDYGLDISNNIFTGFNGEMTSFTGISATYSAILSNPALKEFNQFASIVSVLGNPMSQALDMRNEITRNYLLDQYNVVHYREGTDGIARSKNEVMIVLDEDRLLTDFILGQIGFYTQEEFINRAFRALDHENFCEELWLYHGGHKLDCGYEIPFEILMDQTFRWHPNNNIFQRQLNDPMEILEQMGLGTLGRQPFRYIPYEKEMLSTTGTLDLKIVGILEPNGNLMQGSLSPGFYFTTELAEHIIEQNRNSEIAQFMIDTGISNLRGTSVILPDVVMTLNGSAIPFSVNYHFDDEIKGNSWDVVGGGGFMSFLIEMLGGEDSDDQSGPTPIMTTVTLQSLGANVVAYTHIYVDVDEEGNEIENEVEKIFALPNRIAIYTANFTQKDNVLLWLRAWNNEEIAITLSDGTILEGSDRENVTYTDFLSFIMNMLSMLITIITIALISFTSLALIVSCVMIAIITYVSVVERIKEIGVIRSLGGRKRDISNLFTAETFILGLFSGLIGIAVTYLFTLFINLIVMIFGITSIASFPWWVAIIMVCLSIGLTLISGLSPSKSAARKDPVLALRSE